MRLRTRGALHGWLAKTLWAPLWWAPLLGAMLLSLVLSLVLATPTFADSAQWQGFRAALESRADVLPEEFSLEVAWQRPLGAGYSSPAITAGRIVVSFTSEDHDVVAALDLESGEELWRHTLAPAYRGHDGSEDGPLATPAVDARHVYQLGPRGQLVKLSLDTGEPVWQRQLSDKNSTEPLYGYTSSPLLVGEVVVLMAGGEERAVAAYARSDGAPTWSTGSDSVSYQSPVVAEIRGQRQVIATSDHWIFGLDPASGAELWRHRHSESIAESVHATPLSNSVVLVNRRDQALALELDRGKEGWQVTELWRAPVFGKTYALPFLHDGLLYGFTGRILTAVDPADGSIVWRSRDLKADHLTLVDGHLVALDAEGAVVVTPAMPAGFAAGQRLPVFERGDFAAPAFADGYIVVRNQKHIAAVRVIPAADTRSGPTPSAADED